MKNEVTLTKNSMEKDVVEAGTFFMYEGVMFVFCVIDFGRYNLFSLRSGNRYFSSPVTMEGFLDSEFYKAAEIVHSGSVIQIEVK